MHSSTRTLPLKYRSQFFLRLSLGAEVKCLLFPQREGVPCLCLILGLDLTGLWRVVWNEFRSSGVEVFRICHIVWSLSPEHYHRQCNALEPSHCETTMKNLMSKDLLACIFKANVLETYLFPVFVLLLVRLFRRERLKERCKPSTNTREMKAIRKKGELLELGVGEEKLRWPRSDIHMTLCIFRNCFHWHCFTRPLHTYSSRSLEVCSQGN